MVTSRIPSQGVIRDSIDSAWLEYSGDDLVTEYSRWLTVYNPLYEQWEQGTITYRDYLDRRLQARKEIRQCNYKGSGTAAEGRWRVSNAQKYYDALKRITKYQTPEQILRRAEKQYGCSGSEAIEMAYENIQQEARNAIAGKRRPKDEVTKCATPSMTQE